jgi:hypothetical protein
LEKKIDMKVNSCFLYRAIFGLVIGLIIAAFITGLYVFVTESYGTFWAYSSFEVSDWLINYEGGFVRRGLIGQILYILYQIHPYPIRYAIVILYMAGFGLLSWILVRIFKKEGMSVFILPFTICLYYSFACDLLWTRRDYWALVIALLIYYSYFRFLRYHTTKYYFFFFSFSAFTLLMHEASFFFSFPILIIHSCCITIHGLRNKGMSQLKLSALWIPVLLLFIMIVLHKGDADIMASIWKSWKPCFEAYPMKNGNYPKVGIGVGFLNMASVDAILLHIRLTWLNVFAPYVPSLPFTIYVIVSIYYLVTRINTVDLKLFNLRNIDHVLLSNILIIQFVCLFPMFGFLSCDLGRIVPYWVISSLLLYHVVRQEGADSFIAPAFLNRISVYIQGKIESVKFLSMPWTYCLIILFLPLNSYYGANYEGMIPVHFLSKAMKVLGL